MSSSSSSSSSSVETSHSVTIDESLYSRQLYVLGREAQLKMAASKVLVLGASGLSIELCKNVILAGVHSLTVYDQESVTFDDLSSNFFVTEEDVGRNRAEASIHKLAELNPYVNVSVLNQPFALDLLKNYKVVVVVDQTLAVQSEVADYCHAHGIYIIITESRGVFGSIFCDFGENFVVTDTTGEQEVRFLITSVIPDEYDNTIVTISNTDARHQLQSGDVVQITDISGFEGINGHQYKINVIDPFSFQITTKTPVTGRYERGGFANQVKQPTLVNFDSFSSSFASPGMFACDVCKYDRAEYLHLAFRAMHLFREKHGTLPIAGHTGHADEFLSILNQLNLSLSGDFKISIDNAAATSFLRKFALTCKGNVGPVSAVVGGIAGQEVLKACSGKFMPIKQYAYFDFFDALPSESLSQEEVSPVNSRYDGQIQVFGKKIQSRLSQLSMFVVGAGAIGCEIMKNWAMMGIATEGKGEIHITDPDRIERSNLSRQFLFRNKDIEKPKSTTAANAVLSMNPHMRVRAHELKACPDSESFFNDSFYESMDMICTALDNVTARLYIDNRCVFYQKPMLESGTLGSKGNTQVVVPKLTENYGATTDPPEQSFAICTIKTFPNLIEHTIQWAREIFEELYCKTAAETNMYLNNPACFGSSSGSQQNMQLEMLKRVQESLLKTPKSFEDCIEWARLKFEELFCNIIKQLMYNFPVDRVTDGVPFWSGGKRPPSPLQFNASDEAHLEFIFSSAYLRAKMFGIAVPAGSLNPSYVASVAQSVSVPAFTPKEDIKIATTEEEAKNMTANAAANDIDQILDNAIKSLPNPASLGGFRMDQFEFDKDIDEHMRVVASISNLRARNYKIPEAGLHESRGIAGKIIPAIATTTSLVSGSICMEIFKILEKKPLEAFSNCFYNLALPLFTSMNPEPPKNKVSMIKGKPWKWNQWDVINIENPSWTMGEVIEYFEEEYGLEVDMISCGVTLVFTTMAAPKIQATRRAMKVKELVETVSKKSIPENANFVILEVTALDENGNDVEVPVLRCRIK